MTEEEMSKHYSESNNVIFIFEKDGKVGYHTKGGYLYFGGLLDAVKKRLSDDFRKKLKALE